MPVQVTQHVSPAGVARLGPGHFLGFSLAPEPVAGRNAIFDFACEHRKLISLQNNTAPIFHWSLGAVSPPNPADAAMHFTPDVLPGHVDVYVVGLNFLQCPGYRLQIILLPDNVLLRDTTYVAQSAQDRWSEPFAVVSSV